MFLTIPSPSFMTFLPVYWRHFIGLLSFHHPGFPMRPPHAPHGVKYFWIPALLIEVVFHVMVLHDLMDVFFLAGVVLAVAVFTGMTVLISLVFGHMALTGYFVSTVYRLPILFM